jgi:hypothetical protein
VLPLPFAALAMIAQRKPNNDKGFEELHRCEPDLAREVWFFSASVSNCVLNQGLFQCEALVFANAWPARAAA